MKARYLAIVVPAMTMEENSVLRSDATDRARAVARSFCQRLKKIKEVVILGRDCESHMRLERGLWQVFHEAGFIPYHQTIDDLVDLGDAGASADKILAKAKHMECDAVVVLATPEVAERLLWQLTKPPRPEVSTGHGYLITTSSKRVREC